MAYTNNVHVYCHNKARDDGNFCSEWEIDYLKIIEDKYHLNRETGNHDRLLLFNEQLHEQMTEY